MNRKQLLYSLNWFYTLELQQVDLYLTQSEKVKDIYLKNTLKRIADIERQHAENIRTEIIKRGGSPSPIGDILGPTIGKVMGTISGFTGPIYFLKANISIEEKAMSDYENFILEVGDDEQLLGILWEHLIDEDLHTAWFSNKLREYQEKQITV